MEDRCVVCGEIVPEGRQVCLICETSDKNASNVTMAIWEDIKRNYPMEQSDKADSTRDQNIKADAGKPQLHLVPTEIINCIARVREFGNKKYKDSNSWKRVEKERYIDAMFRHLLKYVNDNNSVDEESGLPHLWHLACNVAFLCEMEKDKE